MFINLIQILEGAAKTENGIHVINSKDNEIYFSYKELVTNSQQVAYNLHSLGLKYGDYCIITTSDIECFIKTFWGCLRYGIIAIPLAHGISDDRLEKMKRIKEQVKEAKIILASQECEDLIKKHPEVYQSFNSDILTFEDISELRAEAVKLPEIGQDHIAYLQYSSGSTSSPKGVILKHRNLISNLHAISEGMDATISDKTLSWMPLSHDMGLIGFHLSPMIEKYNQFHMPTEVFVRRPNLWLEIITDKKITVSGSPNFGLKYSKQNFNGNDCIDLSSLRMIFNGAEPISLNVCREFNETFKYYGLKEEVITPVYGLAEACLAVSFSEHKKKFNSITVNERLKTGEKVIISESPDNSIELANVGTAVKDCNIRIADINDQKLEDEYVGHIQIKGDNVTCGYFGDNDSTADVITNDGWLKTGDIGFIYRGGLYITGRHKEMIIVGGQNYFPQDIECKFEHIRGLETGKLAVSSYIDKNTELEKVICFVLSRKRGDQFAEILNTIKKITLEKLSLDFEYVIPVKNIPKTTSGKIQRKKLVQQFLDGEYDDYIKESCASNAQNVNISEVTIGNKVRAIVEKIISRKINSDTDNLREYGINSLRIEKIQNELQKEFKMFVPVSALFNNETVEQLAKFLFTRINGEESKTASPQKNTGQEKHFNDTNSNNDEIAIVGIGCKYPGNINSPFDLYDALIQKKNLIEDIDESRLNIKEFYDEDRFKKGKSYVKKGAFFDEVDAFDNDFFEITPIESRKMDPQQKVLLETCIQAIHDANMSYEELSNSRTGVYIGITSNDHVLQLLANQMGLVDEYVGTNTLLNAASGRISYFLNLKGPSVSIDTACSSSLTAVHLAVQGLRNNETDVAIVGGANIMQSPYPFVSLSRLQALSPDGNCKAFDDNADGYGRGEGCGVLVLKKLNKALKDNNEIWGVISGSAIGHDGRSNGFTSPNSDAQELVINNALADAKVEPHQISYIEAHGTGTKLGDPIEVEAIRNIYMQNRPEKLFIGSVKSNIGHTEAAAGISGLIKTVLSLKFNEIFPSLHVNTPNQLIDWTNIVLPNEVTKWEQNGKMHRYASVSSFGINGSLSHLVLKEHTHKSPERDGKHQMRGHMSILSGKTKKNLKANIKKACQHIENCSDSAYAEFLAYNNTRTNIYKYCIAVAESNKEDLINVLKNEEYEIIQTSNNRPCVCFVFPGQGSQWVGMGRTLYDKYEIFRNELESCWSLFENFGIHNMKSIFFSETDEPLNDISLIQPLLFSIEVALAKLWMDFGIQPDFVVGHSMGEVASAYVAGALPPESAAQIICYRSKIMKKLEGKGKMLAISLSEEDFTKKYRFNSKIASVAVINNDNEIVLSGDTDELNRLNALLDKDEVFNKFVNVTIASHSPQIDSVLDELKEKINNITTQQNLYPIYSTVIGEKIDWKDMGCEYWIKNLRNPVLFSQTIKEIAKNQDVLFIEMSPHPILSNSINMIGEENGFNIPVIDSFNKEENEDNALSANLLKAHCYGYKIDWNKFYINYNRFRIDVPGYQFNSNKSPVLKAKISYAANENAQGNEQISSVHNTTSVIAHSLQDIKDQIIEIVHLITSIPVEDLEPDRNLLRFGINSMMLVKFKNYLKNLYGVDIPLKRFFTELNTVNKIAEELNKGVPNNMQEERILKK